MSGSKNGKTRKQKARKKDAGPYSPLEVTQRGQGATTMAVCLFICGTVSGSSNPWSEHRSMIFRRQGPLCPLWVAQAVCQLLQKHVCGCLPGGRWVGDRDGLKLTAIYLPSLPLELASLARNCRIVKYSSYIRQILLVQWRDSWCFLFHPLPRIHSSLVFDHLVLPLWTTQHNCAWFWTYINEITCHIFYFNCFLSPYLFIINAFKCSCNSIHSHHYIVFQCTS